LNDTATRKQLNIIQEHLRFLSNDFKRFQRRMDDVTLHIAKAHSEVEQVNISAKKITNRFGQIERVELGESQLPANTNAVLDSEEEDISL
jgi:DNA recombination protein RmuC